MKTIATFSTPEEAHLFRTRLQAAGISAFVQDEYVVQLNWLLSNAIGGVRVQIAEDDLESAREFLAADSPQLCADADDISCPTCGSHLIAPDEKPRRIAFLTLWLFGFPLLFTRRRWRCSACRNVFKLPTGGDSKSRSAEATHGK